MRTGDHVPVARGRMRGDPGSMTNSQRGGSGLLCQENDDVTAERFATQLDDAGIGVSAIP